jgi:hypothetical protein
MMYENKTLDLAIVNSEGYFLSDSIKNGADATIGINPVIV